MNDEDKQRAALRRRHYEKTHPIADIHDMTHPGTSKADREKMNIGDIYTNAVICGECNSYVRSRNRHDYVTCRCGALSVDGGSHYAKRSAKNFDKVVDMTVYFDEK